MKPFYTHLCVMMFFLISVPALGSMDDTSTVNIFFVESNQTFRQYIDSTGGSQKVAVPFTVELKNDSVARHEFFVQITAEYLTTDDSDFKILNPRIWVSKNDLNTRGSLSFEVELEIFSDLDIIAEVFKLRLNLETVNYTPKQHECLITISPEQEKTEEEKKIEAYKQALNANDSLDFAILSLTTQNGLIKYYKRDDSVDKVKTVEDLKEDGSVKIDRVLIHFDNGRFAKVIAFIDGSYDTFASDFEFTAAKYWDYDQWISYKGADPKLKGTYIKTHDLLHYSELTPHSRFPPKTTICLTPSSPTKSIKFFRNPLDYFDARVYTDPLGLLGRANGLVQTQIGGHFVTRTINTRKMTWFSDFNILLDWSRFDSDFDTLSITSFDSLEATSLLGLLQQANLNIDFRQDVFKVENIHTFSTGFGHRISVTSAVDTANNFQRVLNPSLYFYVFGKLSPTPWIDFSTFWPIHLYYHLDGPFKAYQNKIDFILAPEFEVRIKPAEFAKNKNSKSGTSFFARARYYDMTSIYSDRSNFLQIQTGVSFSLGKLIE